MFPQSLNPSSIRRQVEELKRGYVRYARIVGKPSEAEKLTTPVNVDAFTPKPAETGEPDIERHRSLPQKGAGPEAARVGSRAAEPARQTRLIRSGDRILSYHRHRSGVTG